MSACCAALAALLLPAARSGADKVSIGSDAVDAAAAYYAAGQALDGASAIEQISAVYGKQAVVVRRPRPRTDSCAASLPASQRACMLQTQPALHTARSSACHHCCVVAGAPHLTAARAPPWLPARPTPPR